jgi:glutamate synthase domain-containing protein 2
MWCLVGLGFVLLVVAIHDLTQKRHAILRNFPILGHFRYLLESIGPELRQYIVTDNDEERPFSRDQRRWVYATSKRENDYFGFGTDNDLENPSNYLFIKQATFPQLDPQPDEAGYDPDYKIPSAKILGEHRNRTKAFRPASVVNISGMSYGSLSAPAIEALNRGAAIAGCWHNSGEGGLSSFHRFGADVVWQIGTGYFGCRDQDGGFSLEGFRETIAKTPEIKAIEIKLSQGAKAGLGGIVPSSKVTPEIAAIRGIEVGKACLSPARHRAFSDSDSLLDFVEQLAAESGLPVGIKSAVGQMDFWHELVTHMARGNRGVDFIAIDGGEGGTGAAPLVFSDHVSLPFRIGFQRVHGLFDEAGLSEQLTFIGSGKLGFPEMAFHGFAQGCDLIALAREPMLAIGCIQAQRCHSGGCPTGVATQNKWLIRGLDPEHKGARCANYIVSLRKEILRLVRACGKNHPSEIGLGDLEVF